MKKILLSPEMIGFVCFAIFIAGLSYALRGTDAPTPPAEIGYSLYDWQHSTAGDGAYVSQIFGPDTMGNHAILHVRVLPSDTAVYVQLDNDTITKYSKCIVKIDGKSYRYKCVRDSIILIYDSGSAYQQLARTSDFSMTIIQHGVPVNEHKFHTNTKL